MSAIPEGRKFLSINHPFFRQVTEETQVDFLPVSIGNAFTHRCFGARKDVPKEKQRAVYWGEGTSHTSIVIVQPTHVATPAGYCPLCDTLFIVKKEEVRDVAV